MSATRSSTATAIRTIPMMSLNPCVDSELDEPLRAIAPNISDSGAKTQAVTTEMAAITRGVVRAGNGGWLTSKLQNPNFREPSRFKRQKARFGEVETKVSAPQGVQRPGSFELSMYRFPCSRDEASP